MFNSNYSLADIAAATGNKENEGFFGNGWWIILLFLFGFGGNGGGLFGGNSSGIDSGIRGVQQGLCDGFYAVNTGMLTGFANTQNTLAQGFAGINNAITQDTIANMQHTNILENSVQALGTQLSSCCCDLRSDVQRGFCELGYALATESGATRQAIADSTREIVANTNAGIRSILDFLTQDKIATLTAENQALKFAASQQAQNAYLISALKTTTTA